MTQNFHAGRHLRALHRAIAAKIQGVTVRSEGPLHAGMVLTHPLHDTVVAVEVDASPLDGIPPSTAIRILVLPWSEQAHESGQVATLLRANARLQGCAVAIGAIDDYERAVLLVRRVPADVLPPEQIDAAIDDMVWEWAQLNATTGHA